MTAATFLRFVLGGVTIAFAAFGALVAVVWYGWRRHLERPEGQARLLDLLDFDLSPIFARCFAAESAYRSRFSGLVVEACRAAGADIPADACLYLMPRATPNEKRLDGQAFAIWYCAVAVGGVTRVTALETLAGWLGNHERAWLAGILRANEAHPITEALHADDRALLLDALDAHLTKAAACGAGASPAAEVPQ